MPKISIVLPTYNGAKYVTEAINSVLAQSLTDWELLIVYSPSEDNTLELISPFANQDERIRIIHHPKDEGRLPGALNAGFEQAKGEYYTWLSDDNEFRPQSLADMLQILVTQADYILVYSDCTIINEETGQAHLNRKLASRYLAEKNVVTPSFLYRSWLHKRIGGYRRQYFLAEDYDFWIRSYDEGKFYHLNEDLQIYRFHDTSLTLEHTRQHQDKNRVRILHDALENRIWTQKPEARARIYYYLSRIAQGNYQVNETRRYWLQALRFAPILILRLTLRDRGGRFGAMFAKFYTRLKPEHMR